MALEFFEKFPPLDPSHTTPDHSESTTTFSAYPLYFEPIFKERIWGGNKLETLGKTLPHAAIGESWEIAMVGEDVSRIINGVYQGLSLDVLITNFPEQVLGRKVYQQFGKQFPLLFKFLDAKTDLSIQLHPNDALAQKRHQSYGKTEMWYIMQADPGARIILGFENNSSPEQYISHLENKTLPSVLKAYEVQKGDVYFIETGTIHAIGGGILLAEIQQTSDITYRVYDWDRVDAHGKARELHVDLALEAIDYQAKETQIHYPTTPDKQNLLVDSPFFTTHYIDLTKRLEINKKDDSFLVYICTEGTCNLVTHQSSYRLSKGQTILVPAALTQFQLEGQAQLLEVFITI